MGNRNQTFQYIQALAILMVIDDHMSTRIGFLTSIFPYNSFYMPLFIFISGYFYHQMPILENIKHKVRKQFLPYICWGLVGELISYLLLKKGIVNWYAELSPNCLIRTFLIGPPSSITGAIWFVVMLFWVSIVYNCIQRTFNRNSIYVKDLSLLIIFVALGFGTLYLCMHGYQNKSIYWLVVLRDVFYLQFFHIGYFFHKYLQKYIDKRNKLMVSLLCVGINAVLLCFKDIDFPSTEGMSFFHSWKLPLITSLTGILFYYEVMSFLSSKIGERKEINFIAQNTFTIMASHLAFINIPNFYVYYKILHGSKAYANFNMAAFRTSAWIRYSPNTRLVGFFLGAIGGIFIAWALGQVKKWLRSKFLNLKLLKRC